MNAIERRMAAKKGAATRAAQKHARAMYEQDRAARSSHPFVPSPLRPIECVICGRKREAHVG